MPQSPKDTPENTLAATSEIPAERFFNLFRDAGIQNAETWRQAFMAESAEDLVGSDAVPPDEADNRNK